ncbi:MAG TPA: class 1 fructose-bisphosphatase [Methylomirabilota bacterium]|jgi:fructose-1,6-bisphosphatase I
MTTLEATTLDAYLDGGHGPDAADLAALLRALAGAGVTIADELARAALIGQLGTTGGTNVQGEKVKKLDLWANDVVVPALGATGRACTLVSEEMEEIRHDRGQCGSAGFIVCFDPVDGSSNLDVNGIVGTIFSILRRRASGLDHAPADVLQPGTAQVAAGYIMYGPSTLLVVTTGDGVHGFTLDRARGTYVRTHANVRIPAHGRAYSLNDGNWSRWPAGVRRFVEHLRETDVATGRPYTARYAGSLVTDVHRTLLEGGIYLYPEDAAAGGKPSGKLRLMYEAAPMAWLIEQAGGRASTGRERILDLVPTSPHQRVPLVIGSAEDVRLAEEFYAERRW